MHIVIVKATRALDTEGYPGADFSYQVLSNLGDHWVGVQTALDNRRTAKVFRSIDTANKYRKVAEVNSDLIDIGLIAGTGWAVLESLPTPEELAHSSGGIYYYANFEKSFFYRVAINASDDTAKVSQNGRTWLTSVATERNCLRKLIKDYNLKRTLDPFCDPRIRESMELNNV